MKDQFNAGKKHVLFTGTLANSLAKLFSIIKLKNREVHSKEAQVKESYYFVSIERIAYT